MKKFKPILNTVIYVREKDSQSFFLRIYNKKHVNRDSHIAFSPILQSSIFDVPEILNVHVNENNEKINFFMRIFFQTVKN